VWLDEDDDDEVMRRVAAHPESAHAGCGGVYTAVVTRGTRDLLMRLLDAGVRVPPKPDGCRSYLLEQPDMLRLLLMRGGLDPDYTDESRWTLLHALCGRDRRRRTMTHPTECAGILLDAGATISARDKNGLTPPELARRNNLPDMVEFLSARGGSRPLRQLSGNPRRVVVSDSRVDVTAPDPRHGREVVCPCGANGPSSTFRL
jgi:hypothetical protein